MKLKRLLAFMLAVMLFASACSTGTGTGTNNTDNSAESTADETETAAEQETEPADPAKTLDLPDTDWGGREYRVLGYACIYSQFETFEISSEGENGEVVNDAIYRRNTGIEDKYNVKITEYKDDSNTGDWSGANYPYFQRTTLAGEDLYDLAFLSIAQIGTAAREHYLQDLNQVEYIDFSKDWWNQNVNDTFTLYDQLYFTSSDFSLRDKNRTYILAFNKDMVNNYALEDPFALVKEGKWTLDVMTAWAEKVSQDTDGNGKVDYTDTFGIGCDSYNAFTAFVYGGDVSTMGKDDTGALTLTLNNEHTVNVLDKVFESFGSKSLTVVCDDWSGKSGDLNMWAVASTAFYEGRALLATAFPADLSDLSEKCEHDYGIIPFPKYDEAQEQYCTYADYMGMLFGIPITCGDPSFAGFMIEALSAASTDTTLQAYYEVSCKTKYTYDEESAGMLDLIFSNIKYDLAKIYGVTGASDFIYTIGIRRKNTFASRYASVESKALVDIEALIADFTEQE